MNPAKIHITVPRRHRPQRAIPRAYVIHREDLDPAEVTAIEGVPAVKLTRALRQCARDHLGRRSRCVRHQRHITTYPDWGDRYAAMASSLDMPVTGLDEAVDVVQAFIRAIDTS